MQMQLGCQTKALYMYAFVDISLVNFNSPTVLHASVISSDAYPFVHMMAFEGLVGNASNWYSLDGQ